MEFFFSSVLSSSTWKKIFFYKHVSSGQAQNCCIFYWAPLPSPRGESAGTVEPHPTWALPAAAEQGLGPMLFTPAHALCSIFTLPALHTQHSCLQPQVESQQPPQAPVQAPWLCPQNVQTLINLLNGRQRSPGKLVCIKSLAMPPPAY